MFFNTFGEKIAETEFVNDIKEGIDRKFYSYDQSAKRPSTPVEWKEGEYNRYYFSGQVQLEGTYSDGKKDGKWTNTSKTAPSARKEVTKSVSVTASGNFTTARATSSANPSTRTESTRRSSKRTKEGRRSQESRREEEGRREGKTTCSGQRLRRQRSLQPKK